ncbi:hypothetical protein ACFLS1_01445 [Verrucomicrobiota bacterium]
MKKPYKTTEEFYAAVEKLIVSLRSDGHESESQRLDIILHGVWTTGSELIGELMLCLADIKLDLPKDLKKLKEDCHYFAKHHRKILGLN